MPERSPIAQYLQDLNTHLRLPGKRKARVLAEAEDHLREAAAENVDAGVPPLDAERQAAAHFGSAEDLARDLNERRLTRLLIGLIAIAGIFDVALNPGLFIGRRAFATSPWEWGFLNTEGVLLLILAGGLIGYIIPRQGVRGATLLGFVGGAWALFSLRVFVRSVIIVRGFPDSTLGWHSFRGRWWTWGYAFYTPRTGWVPVFPVMCVLVDVFHALEICALVILGSLMGSALRRRRSQPVTAR